MDDVDTNETALLLSRSGVPLDKPDYRRPYQKQLAVYSILTSTALERLAFYSLVINLVSTLQLSQLDWDPGNSITASFIFSGVSYISTLIFAILSDAKLGRAKTIIIVGAIQANIAVFGAEQVQELNKPSRFFDKYIVAVNIGGLFATLLVPSIQTFQSDPNRFFHGYIFSMTLLFCGTLLFILGNRFYLHVEPHDTIITKCIPVIISAFRTWRQYKVDKHITTNTRRSTSSTVFSLESFNSRSDKWTAINDKSPSFLDFARVSHNGRYMDRVVDDVKSLRRVIIVFLLLIPYWIIYYQIQTTFLLQGQHMQLPYINKTPMPAIWMIIGDQGSIIIGILILNIFVYKRLINYDQSSLMQTKFVIGMLLASISMFIAGMIEIFRQHECKDDDNSTLSIFTQLPQYIAVGISEVFAMVASFEFAYLAAPRSAQSLIMSLRFCSLGLSSFIGNAYVRIFTTKINEEFEFDCPNSTKIFYVYFYVLGSIQLFAAFLFLLCNRKFDILRLNPHKINKNQFI